MTRKSLWLGLALLCFALLPAACRPVSREGAAAAAAAAVPGALTPDASAEAQIASAVSAAPQSLTQNANVLGFWPADGSPPLVLRAGTNGWNCWPDDPNTPHASPECDEEGWQAFWNVATPEKKPDLKSVGLAIMLQGGTEASTTQFDVAKPPPGQDWIFNPEHIMLVVPGDLSPADFSTDPHSGLPYIMWEGSTMEHLMVPVNLSAFDEPDPKIRSAMSAAPLAVAKDATIVDYPSEPGGEPTVLRQGTNGWTCYPDWPASPANDPECNDAPFEAWFRALMSGAPQPPELTRPGFAYMLQGGADPSNTDPMAAEPPAGEDWVISPPHAMLIVPEGFASSSFTTDPDSGEPFIMWQGTPHEHLMVPVADKE